VAEQELNGTQVSTGLQQMGSEAVAQGMGVDTLVDSRPFGGLLHGVEDAPGIDGDVGVRMGTFGGKQIRLRLGVGPAPVVAKFLQQSRAEHDIAIFPALKQEGRAPTQWESAFWQVLNTESIRLSCLAGFCAPDGTDLQKEGPQ